MGSTLEVGVVVKPHGVRGALKVHLHNERSTALEGSQPLILALGGEERRVQARSLGTAGGQVILEVEGVTDREAAEQLRGARVLLDRDQLEPLGEGEYYHVDLIGCVVEDEERGVLGEVAEVFSAGAGDVLVVRDATGERMIPLVEEWVVSVDLEARRIRVRGGEQWETSEG